MLIVQVEHDAPCIDEGTVQTQVEFLAHDHWDLGKYGVKIWSAFTVFLEEVNRW